MKTNSVPLRLPVVTFYTVLIYPNCIDTNYLIVSITFISNAILNSYFNATSLCSFIMYLI